MNIKKMFSLPKHVQIRSVCLCKCCRILSSSLRQNVSIKLTDCALVVKAIFVFYVIFVTFSICYEKTANCGAVAPCLFPQHTDVYHWNSLRANFKCTAAISLDKWLSQQLFHWLTNRNYLQNDFWSVNWKVYFKIMSVYKLWVKLNKCPCNFICCSYFLLFKFISSLFRLFGSFLDCSWPTT